MQDHQNKDSGLLNFLHWWYSKRETQTALYCDPNITHWLWLFLFTGKVKTDEVKKVPESASWLAKSKNFDLILSQLQMLLFKSWVTLICTINRGGALHIFLLWPVIKLSFDAKMKPAGLSLPLTCHRSSWVCFIACSVKSYQAHSEVWQDVRIERILCRGLISQLQFLASCPCCGTELEHEGGLLLEAFTGRAPCTGWNGHKFGLLVWRLRVSKMLDY